MRLIERKVDGELVLKSFYKNIPPYAILSHTWGDENEKVTLQEIMDGSGKKKSGYKKIQSCAAQAASDGWQHTWVDTCCIDKTSSAELSEAINSMFKWYQDAEICYAYISDVHDIRGLDSSRWFKRGWTLQELIAPKNIVFYTRDWDMIDTKSNLTSTISRITGIPREVLAPEITGTYSVAQILSWAAGRETTREEDIAYCLLGLLGIHMPLLYGEGSRAFERLQQEYIKTSTDHTLFMWQGAGTARGPFAQSPEEFRHCRGFTEGSRHQYRYETDFSMTNKGLLIYLPILTDREGNLIAFLDCVDAERRQLVIYLKRRFFHGYYRIRCAEELPRMEIEGYDSIEKLHIMSAAPRTLGRGQWQSKVAEYTFEVDSRPALLKGFSLKQFHSSSDLGGWNTHRSNDGFWEYTAMDSDVYGAHRFHNAETGEEFVVVIGVHKYKAWLEVTIIGSSETFEDVVDEYYHYGKKHTDNNVTCRCAMPSKALDRIDKTLLHGLSVVATIENDKLEDEFVVTIQVCVDESISRG